MNYTGNLFVPRECITEFVNTRTLTRWLQSDHIKVVLDPTSATCGDGYRRGDLTDIHIPYTGLWYNLEDIFNCLYTSSGLRNRMAGILGVPRNTLYSPFLEAFRGYIQNLRPEVTDEETDDMVQAFPLKIERNELSILGYGDNTTIKTLIRYLRNNPRDFCGDDYVVLRVPHPNSVFSATTSKKIKILRMTEDCWERLQTKHAVVEEQMKRRKEKPVKITI